MSVQKPSLSRICLDSEPDTSTVYGNKNRIYTVATGPAVTGLGYYADIQIIFGTVYTLYSLKRGWLVLNDKCSHQHVDSKI